MWRALLFTVLIFGSAPGQVPDASNARIEGARTDRDKEDVKLPNGKSQRDEMLKADYQKNLADVAELARLSAEVKNDIERNDRYVVSVKTLKKLDDIDKLAHTIRGRLNRY